LAAFVVFVDNWRMLVAVKKMIVLVILVDGNFLEIVPESQHMTIAYPNVSVFLFWFFFGVKGAEYVMLYFWDIDSLGSHVDCFE